MGTKKRITFWGQKCFLAASLSLCLLIPRFVSADSILSSLTAKTQAVVSIECQAGGVVGAPPTPYLHKETGTIIIRRDLQPFIYTTHGAGVIVHGAGLIVTNAHSLIEGGRITVKLHDGSVHAGTLIQHVPDKDLSLIKIEPPYRLEVFELSNSDALAVDNQVYSIGSSQLLKDTISEGKISGFAVSKSQQKNGVKDTAFIQVNFDLYKGDSGSPLVSTEGKLIGIMAAQPTNVHNVVFAIPSNMIWRSFQQHLSIEQTKPANPAKIPVKTKAPVKSKQSSDLVSKY